MRLYTLLGEVPLEVERSDVTLENDDICFYAHSLDDAREVVLDLKHNRVKFDEIESLINGARVRIISPAID